jgi:hypothetical protein
MHASIQSYLSPQERACSMGLLKVAPLSSRSSPYPLPSKLRCRGLLVGDGNANLWLTNDVIGFSAFSMTSDLPFSSCHVDWGIFGQLATRATGHLGFGVFTTKQCLWHGGSLFQGRVAL